MKPALMLIAPILLTNTLLCQELKREYSQDKYGLKESFTVLKTDTKVRHGDFSLTFKNVPYQTGQYKMGEKSGLWTYYYQNDIEFIYDFDKNIVSSDTIGVGRNALYADGESMFDYLIFCHIKYPEEALSNSIQGNVTIAFTINTDGTPENFGVKVGCGNVALNQEALRVVSKVARLGKWLPAINDKGEETKSTMEKTVHFQLK